MLQDRFLRYVKIDTQSDETSRSIPSTMKQLDLCDLLKDECEALDLKEVQLNAGGTLTATIPSNVSHKSPTITWFAHVDTSPEYSGKNVKPVVHENYSGGDIVLPGDSSQVIRVSEHPELKELHGCTIITTDGTTLLGSDDKSGVAVIMDAAEYLMNHSEISHGPIRICFTCDEEIGKGVEQVDIENLDSVCGYTLDGDAHGKVDCETFSADQAIVRVKGINTHPSIGKDAMVNAIRILCQFLSELPTSSDAPEVTDGRDGFIHPYHLEGEVSQATARLILRDFETSKLKEYATLLESIAEPLRQKYPRASITIDIHKQYRNMREGLKKEPRALLFALEATKRAGMEPIQTIIRGGTDGSFLTEKGLPTPNLSTGTHSPHCPLEWTCLEEMEQARNVLIELAQLWGEERL